MRYIKLRGIYTYTNQILVCVNSLIIHIMPMIFGHLSKLYAWILWGCVIKCICFPYQTIEQLKLKIDMRLYWHLIYTHYKALHEIFTLNSFLLKLTKHLWFIRDPYLAFFEWYIYCMLLKHYALNMVNRWEEIYK